MDHSNTSTNERSHQKHMTPDGDSDYYGYTESNAKPKEFDPCHQMLGKMTNSNIGEHEKRKQITTKDSRHHAKLITDVVLCPKTAKMDVALCVATPKVAKSRSKATGDLFRCRERRLKAVREALDEASSKGNKKSRTQYAVMWKDVDDVWLKLMEHESKKSYAKKIGETVSDESMKAIDANLDELESWMISVL